MKSISSLLASILLPVAVFAQGATPPQTIDVKSLPAKVVNNVLIPVPSEIFSVLDKLGKPDWRAQLRSTVNKKPGDRTQTALLLGAVVAEGFIAVQARDAEEVKKIGKDVLDLSTAIGVRESVLAHCNSIIEAADKKDWATVRTELDKAQKDVRSAMVELKDEQLSQLVSIGGWLRGTEVLTNIVEDSYTVDGAELLHQPDVLGAFENQLSVMKPAIKANPLVGDIQIQLKVIRPLIDVEDGRKISEASVKEINGITSGLVRKIVPSQP